MKLHTAAIAILAASLIGSAGFAYNGKFPGRGSRAAWEKAAALYNRAIDMESKKQIESAIALYDEAIKQYPYDPDFYANLALMYVHYKQDFKRSEQLLSKAISLSPHDATFRLGLVGCLLDQNKHQQARQEIRNVEKVSLTADQRSKLRMLKQQLNHRATNHD